MKYFIQRTALAGILAFACLTVTAQNAVETLPRDSNILKRMDVKALLTPPVSLRGNLAYWVNTNNEFVIYAETATAKHLFVLQTEKARKIKPAADKFTEVTYLGDGMVLSDGKDNYFFGTGTDAEKQLLKKAHLEDRNFKAIIYGYGLSHHELSLQDKNISLDKLKGMKSVMPLLDK